MDGEAWGVTARGVTKNWTRLTDCRHTQSEAWDADVIAVLTWMGKALRFLSFMSLAHHRQTVTQTKHIDQMDARYCW